MPPADARGHLEPLTPRGGMRPRTTAWRVLIADRIRLGPIATQRAKRDQTGTAAAGSPKPSQPD